MSTNTELTAYQEPSLLADLQKYAASYPVAWERLKETLPDPAVATDEDTEKVTDLLTKERPDIKNGRNGGWNLHESWIWQKRN